MKKVLIGTTALVAASMLSLPAMAMHMDEDGNYQVHTGNLSLSIGGYGTFKVEYKSREPKEDDTESYRSHNADFDSELHFEGSTTLASGTEAGIKIEFETGGKEVDGDDAIDQNFIWVEGMLGKVYLGGRDAEELEESVERTYSGVGLLAADKGKNSASITTSADFAGGENNKIIWVAPKVGGIEFAINYTPERKQNTTDNTTNEDVGQEGEDLLIALRWTGTMGGAATIKASLGYGTNNVENDSQRLGFEISGIADLTIGGFWMKHADYSEAKIEEGGEITHVPEGGEITHVTKAREITPKTTEDEVTMGIGGKWDSGKWEVGIGWETSKHDEMNEAGVKDGTDNVTRMDIGVTYDFNDDMLIKVGYRQEKYEDDANVAENENSTQSFDVKFEWNVGPGLEFDVGLQNFRYTHHEGLATPAKRTGTAGYILTKVSF